MSTEKTVKTITVADVPHGVMNVLSLGNKLDYVIDHITDNILDIVGLHHRPINTGRMGGGVGVLINQINVKSNEFNDYLAKLSCINGNIVILGDFNIDWLNTNGSERNQFCNILEESNFFKIYVQKHIEAIVYLTILSLIIIIAVGRMRQRLPSFPVLLYGVSPYISL